MRKVELEIKDDQVDFFQAEKIADSRAEDELGDCIRLGWYNKDKNRVSPMDLMGKPEAPEAGVVAFAESRGAEMEIDVLGGRYRFYYKKFDD
jgi:Domain of unknown function (DUF5619)